MDDQLYCNPDLAQFYDLENGWDMDMDYCARLAEDAASVLDLGCGTGTFLSRLAGERRLVGVDPAAAMLNIARRQPGADTVTWIEADARNVRLNEKFDLIVLTGHAFQVFLTREDQRATLATIAAHLAPQGRFIFDSRNPEIEVWHTWGPDETRRNLEHPVFGTVEAWSAVSQDEATRIVTYETHYRVRPDDQLFSASSKINFSSKDHIAELIDEAGLAVDAWFGDWQATPWQETSYDIIPLGRLA